MSAIAGVVDKLLGIFGKALKLKADPSLRIEKEIEKLEKEKSKIVKMGAEIQLRKRLDWVDSRISELRKEQGRIAARA